MAKATRAKTTRAKATRAKAGTKTKGKAAKARPSPRNKKLYDEGMKVRKAVLGAGYVDNSMAGADDFMMSFQDVTTEYCWGYVWTRPGLPKKTRSMLNLAMLAALNRGPEAPPSGSASFALAPEDDGIAAAEYLLSRNVRRVLVLVGGDDGLRRSVAAFREQWNRRGGTIVETLTIADKPVDGTAALQAAAQKDGGVDAVFLALKGAQARAVAPQLTLAGLGDKPRVATAQLLSGTGKPDQDRALDGIVFPGETWTVQGLPGLPPADSTGAALISARGPAAKLFAFGHDAWLLTGYLDAIAHQADRAVPGATGQLRLDGFGNVVRVPAWSNFSSGEIVALGKRGD